MPQIVCNRRRKPLIGEIVEAVSCLRRVAACELVFALGAGFHMSKLVSDGIIDGLIVTRFEMQKAVIFEAAPVTAIQRISPMKLSAPAT